MVFRGVILNALKKRWNIKVAVIVPSMLFGIVHVLGQDFSIGSCLLVIIAGTMVGVMFSMIAIESGSVWNSSCYLERCDYWWRISHWGKNG